MQTREFLSSELRETISQRHQDGSHWQSTTPSGIQDCQGQAIVEYLVVLAAIVAVLATVSEFAGCRILSLMTTAVNHVP